MILIEKKTLDQTYKIIKNEFNNPFEKSNYIKNFDEEINQKLIETMNYSSIWQQIQEEEFLTFDDL